MALLSAEIEALDWEIGELIRAAGLEPVHQLPQSLPGRRLRQRAFWPKAGRT